MKPVSLRSVALPIFHALVLVAGCGNASQPEPLSVPGPTSNGTAWMGIPSAVNQIVVYLHEGTGWLLNKSEVSVKKSGDVRKGEGSLSDFVADFQITVQFGSETFETTATEIPCDEFGIPTEESVDRLRAAVEEIKDKMKRLQE